MAASRSGGGVFIPVFCPLVRRSGRWVTERLASCSRLSSLFSTEGTREQTDYHGARVILKNHTDTLAQGCESANFIANRLAFFC